VAAPREPSPGSPHDLIRVGLTLTAIAVAVSAFVQAGPFVPFFLLAGLLAAVSTGYAMAQLWADAGLSVKHLFALARRPQGHDARYDALLYATWAMIALVVALGAFLLTTYRR
jgi:hypothetical protein